MSYTTLAQVSLNSHMYGGYIMTMIEEEKAPNWIIDQLNTWILTINRQPLTTVLFRSFLERHLQGKIHPKGRILSCTSVPPFCVAKEGTQG